MRAFSLPGPARMLPGADVLLAAGGFGQKEAPAGLSELRLVLPRAKGYFFVLVEGS